ncbi:MAG: hypothetical protein PHT40_02330 [Patescibacteria group bacterium]|nr:hypothetical protein [Patescibacteria group bacterium]
MFLTVHAAAGLIIGKYIHNSLLAFLAGFISHLILDAIPHDPKDPKKWRLSKNFQFFFIVMFLEVPLTIIIGTWLFINNELILNWPTFWAIVGSVILDFLYGLNYLFPKLKIFSIFDRFNYWIHIRFITNYKLPWYAWLPIQLSALVIFLLIYIS